MNTIPTILENIGNEKFVYDLYSRLLKDRIIFLSGAIDESISKLVIAQLLYLEKQDPSADINMYINSPGGALSDALAIFDTMRHVKCDTSTIGVGMAASGGALLLASGKKGKRYSLPHCNIMIHQPHISGGGIEGQVTDLEITVKQLTRNKERFAKVMAKNTGQKYEKVKEDMERDKWFDALEAKKYGLIDKVIKQ